MKIRNHPYLFPALIALIFIISYSYTFDCKLAPLGDNASYYMLGKALSDGEGFVNISKYDKTPNNHFPPGYPVILSLFMHFTESIIFFKLLNGAFLLGSMILLFALCRKLLDDNILALVIVMMCLLNFHVLQYGSMMMSEIPYMFFSLAGIWLFTASRDGKAFYRDRNFYFLVAAVVLSYYIRALGIALAGAAGLAILLERKWIKAISFGGAFVLLVLPWFIRSQQLGGGSYTRQLVLINPYQPNLGKAGFSDFMDRIINNASRYITEEIPNALFPFTEVNYRDSATAGDWIIGLILIGLVIFGLFRLKKYRTLIACYVLFTFLILMIWPDVWVGVRFIVPMIPILSLGLIHGMYSLLGQFFTAAKRKVPAAILFVIPVLLISSVSKLHEQASTPLHPAWENYYAMGKWLRSRENKNVVVSCGKPALFYMYSRTFTMRYPFEQDPEKLLQELENEKVDYVVIDQVYPNTIRYLLPAVRSHPERFEQVYHVPNPDTYLLRFKR